MWKASKFFWVCFILPPFYLHSCLARIDNLSETESGAACVTGGAVLLFFCFDIGTSKDGLLMDTY